jgi:hypothetical protein
MSSRIKFDQTINNSEGVQKKVQFKSVPHNNKENKRSYADAVQGETK